MMLFRALTVAEILAEERGRVQEKWSDAARAASIRARQGLAWAAGKARQDAGQRQAAVERQRRREAAKRKGSGGKGDDPEAAAKKAERERRAELAKPFDAKLKTQGDELKAMAARGEKGSDAYRQKYEAYRATQQEKRKALGTDAVEAPERAKPAPKAKAAEDEDEKPPARRVKRKVIHRPPAVRNRGRQARIARVD